MPLPRVTGIVWWRMGRSHYKAIYRRARADEDEDGYTKDFLQAPLAISDRLRAMFGGVDPPYEPITYRWPSGAFDSGKVYPASDYDHERGRGRLEVGQWTQAGAPAPWQLGDPLVDPVTTLPGDPDARIPDDADAQWDRLEDLDPWLMLIQLENSAEELHLRAYLGAPPPDLVDADLAHVPADVRSHMAGQGGLSGDELPDLWFDPDDLRDPWRLAPDEEGREASRPPAAGGEAAGVAYRLANESPSSAAPEPFAVDPNERDRATRAHAITQNALATAVAELGREPLSPPGEPNYDLGWVEPDGTFIVAEVKSITARNEERQMRFGLGQVLRYRHVLETTAHPTRALLVTSAAPSDARWRVLCAELGIGLIWPPGLAEALRAWL